MDLIGFFHLLLNFSGRFCLFVLYQLITINFVFVFYSFISLTGNVRTILKVQSVEYHFNYCQSNQDCSTVRLFNLYVPINVGNNNYEGRVSYRIEL